MRQDYITGDGESLSPIEKEIERALRPLSFDDFTGQDKILENLKIFCFSCQTTKRSP
jgi:Holliday junction DNA helicase RuvB